MSDRFGRLQGARSHLAVKAPVRAASTGNLTLEGYQTIDGVAYSNAGRLAGENMRVLVKDQTDPIQNGIYVVDQDPWQRAQDFNGNTDFVQGTLIAVADGSVNGDSLWRVTSTDPPSLGETAVTFESSSALITVSDAAYDAGTWNGSVAAPTQNAVRDKFELLTGTTLPAAYQPLDGDLTAIAALTTEAYGRAFLTLVNATALTALSNAFTGDSGSGGVKGLVPSPAAGDAAAGKFLKADGTWTANSSSALPAGYIFGLTLSNGTDTTNDINIAAGRCRDSTNAVDIVIATAMGKQLDADWTTGGTTGSPAGGRNSGAAITNTTYHVYAVAEAGGANPDIYFHASATVATVLTALQAETSPSGANYIYARRIGSFQRVSAAIKQFRQRGDLFEFDVATSIIAGGTATSAIGTSAVTRTATDVPTGISVLARIKGYMRNGGVNATNYGVWTALDQTDTQATSNFFDVVANGSGASDQGMESGGKDVSLDTSGQFRTRYDANSASITVGLHCQGWIDRRGQDGGA
jgi:hypothetical protein